MKTKTTKTTEQKKEKKEKKIITPTDKASREKKSCACAFLDEKKKKKEKEKKKHENSFSLPGSNAQKKAAEGEKMPMLTTTMNVTSEDQVFSSFMSPSCWQHERFLLALDNLLMLKLVPIFVLSPLSLSEHWTCLSSMRF